MPIKDDFIEQVKEKNSERDHSQPDSERDDKYLIDHQDYNPISQQEADPNRDDDFRKKIKPEEAD